MYNKYYIVLSTAITSYHIIIQEINFFIYLHDKFYIIIT